MDLWCWKWLLYPLSHNHCPCEGYLCKLWASWLVNHDHGTCSCQSDGPAPDWLYFMNSLALLRYCRSISETIQISFHRFPFCLSSSSFDCFLQRKTKIKESIHVKRFHSSCWMIWTYFARSKKVSACDPPLPERFRLPRGFSLLRGPGSNFELNPKQFIFFRIRFMKDPLFVPIRVTLW